MRTTRTCNLFLLALPLLLFALGPSWVANAPAAESKFTPQQEEYVRLLREEALAFAALHPGLGDVSDLSPEALQRRRELAPLWQERVAAMLDRLQLDSGPTAITKWQVDTDQSNQPLEATALLPNENVSLPGAPDQNNASFSYHEAIGGQAFGVWTEHFAPFGLPPTQVWFSATGAAGGGAPWPTFFPPTPVLTIGLPESWNPSMAAVTPITPDAFYMTMVEWAAPALTPGSPSQIVTNTAMGGGFGFPSGTGPAFVYAPPIGNWVDYPYLVVDDVPGNLGPPGLGDVHVAWVEYIEGGDGDLDGNGVWYDDPADLYQIWVASANTGAGPQLYPGFANFWVLWVGPVLPTAHQCHRPSLSVVGPTGTPPPVAIPPSGVYCAWFDGAGGAILLDASPQPGAGAPWLALGPLAVPVPVVGLPPVLNGNIKSATTVSVAVDNGPLFPGQVYLAWADFAAGDADILFSSSPDGGLTWTPPVRVHQDPIGNGADQWAPHMMVDPATGDIKITYYDRRQDPANLNMETWASSSMDGGITWNDWIISDAGPTPPVTGLAVGPFAYIGDYLTSDFNPLNGWGAIYNDGRNGADQDVFFENVQTPPVLDSDGDGIPDPLDNCPTIFNPGQADFDGDGIGDTCDTCTDTDGDGFGNPGFVVNTCPPDNCPTIFNPGQADFDGDGIGDTCDTCTDTDGDGFGNPGFASNICPPDNCPTIFNPGQADFDGDGIGDTCDTCTDTDGDGFGNPGFASNICPPDNCPTTFNPGQADVDGDSHGDACDNCLAVANPNQAITIAITGDVNNSTTLDAADIVYLVNYVFKSGPSPLPCTPSGDVNCSAAIDAADVIYMVLHVFKSGIAPCDICLATGLGWTCP